LQRPSFNTSNIRSKLLLYSSSTTSDRSARRTCLGRVLNAEGA
jgi:hypothetical protein